MDNQILFQVLAAFAQRRQADEAEENRRLAEIAQKYPDLNALLQARHGMVMRLVQSAFSSGGEANPEAAHGKRLSRRLSFAHPRLRRLRRYGLCVRGLRAPHVRLPAPGVSFRAFPPRAGGRPRHAL